MRERSILIKSWETKGLTGSNAEFAVAGVYGCGWLRFLAVLRDLYDVGVENGHDEVNVQISTIYKYYSPQRSFSR